MVNMVPVTQFMLGKTNQLLLTSAPPRLVRNGNEEWN